MRYGPESAYGRRSHEGGGRVTEIASKLSNPCARSEDLIVEELGEELLVYDMKADRGHCLSPTAARVWRRCDGRTPAKDMSAELDLDPDAVGRALDELAACKLLEPTPELTVVAANGDGATRRELATRFVKAGAVAAAAPLIVSVVAPTPAQAQTLAFCRAVATTPGCGSAQPRATVAAATRTAGITKDCVPDDPLGWLLCCAAIVGRPSSPPAAAHPAPSPAPGPRRPRAPSSEPKDSSMPTSEASADRRPPH